MGMSNLTDFILSTVFYIRDTSSCVFPVPHHQHHPSTNTRLLKNHSSHSREEHSSAYVCRMWSWRARAGAKPQLGQSHFCSTNMDLRNQNTGWWLCSLREDWCWGRVTIFCHAHTRAEEACLQRKRRRKQRHRKSDETTQRGNSCPWPWQSPSPWFPTLMKPKSMPCPWV